MEVDRPHASGPHAISRHWTDIRHLLTDLTDIRADPWRHATVARRNVLAVTCVFGLVMLIIGAELLAGPVALPLLVALLLAAAKVAPMPLATIRPVLAWWWSLAVLVVLALVFAAAGVRADWLRTGVITHLVVTLVVAAQCRPLVVATQWLCSMIVASVVQMLLPDQLSAGDLLIFMVVSLVGITLIAGVRTLRRTRRQLREQERLTDQERDRRAVLEERTRIARELHDVVAHHMSVVAVQAEAAPYRVTDAPPELRESFASIRENAVAALGEMRYVLGMLRADAADPDGDYAPQPGLDDVGELLDNVRAAGLAVELVGNGTRRPLPTLVELSMFRIVQEALSNALRHAPGSQVRVVLDYGLETVGVRVTNTMPTDGPVPSPLSSGHGLRGMRERASALGGEFAARSREDGWFEVTASIPCAEGDSV